MTPHDSHHDSQHHNSHDSQHPGHPHADWDELDAEDVDDFDGPGADDSEVPDDREDRDDRRGRRRGPRGHRHGRRGPGRFAPPDFGPGDFGPGEFGPGFGSAPFGPGAFGPAGFGRGGFGPGPGGFGPMGGPGGPGRRGPGMRRRRKGAVRLAILSLLAEQSTNGYGLIQAIAERTNGTWTPSPGSVYPTLQQLVDEGLIEPATADRSSDYRLTEQGAAYVAEHSDELATAWASAQDESRGSTELRTSIGQLMGVVHQYRFATQDQRARAVVKLDETRKALYAILAE